MQVCALVFTIGISCGHKELIGIYDDWDKAKEVMEKHCYGMHHYSMHEIELNKEVNITFAEW